MIICESDDSEDDDDDKHDADHIEMQHIYEQQERNRNRKQVSEVCDSQVKTESDNTKDIGIQGTHHTSLETVESLTPLSTEDTKEHSTIPDSEDLLEVGASQQSKESKASEERLQAVMVKMSKRPKVSRGEIQLYVHPR